VGRRRWGRARGRDWTAGICRDPVYTQPLRLGIPAWIHAALWLPRIAAVASVLLLASARLRSRRGIAIAGGAVLLLLLELYWRTPPPGLGTT
jgi:hypothetical protein